MSAGRLLSIMMLLQTRGRMSARALAGELEVSIRTVYRDVDALSASGVPVVVERGSAGGFELLGGWRTKLTGLTPSEAQALFVSGLPGPAAQLGLDGAMVSAQLKLLAALPAEWQAEARRVSTRFHLDPVGWYRKPSPTTFLRTIADAVWTDHRLEIVYESWKENVRRTVDPLGLVLKAGEWYLVARAGASARTYRLSSLHALTVADKSFTRPRDFDLAAYWEESTRRFEKDLYRGEALVRASPRGLKSLRGLCAAVAEAVDRARIEPDAEGWARLVIPIESPEHAAREMLKVGPEVEILEPDEVRQKLLDTLRRMQALYGRRRAQNPKRAAVP